MLKTLPGSASGEADGETVARPPARRTLYDYPSPAAVLADGRLSRAERLRVLDAWVLHITDRDLAAGEASGDEATLLPAADETLLREVNEAIARVEASPAVPGNLFGRIWQILTRD